MDCVIKDGAVTVVLSKSAVKYHTIQEGVCEGTIIGGNLCTLNLLQGTPYMPDIRDKVLFLEDDNIMGEYFCYEFDRNLESLLQVEGADTIKGIIFGRFDDSCGLTAETITDIIRDKVPSHIPVVFGVDFGHIFPMITFPIVGSVRIQANQDKAEIVIIAHLTNRQYDVRHLTIPTPFNERPEGAVHIGTGCFFQKTASRC